MNGNEKGNGNGNGNGTVPERENWENRAQGALYLGSGLLILHWTRMPVGDGSRLCGKAIVTAVCAMYFPTSLYV